MDISCAFATGPDTPEHVEIAERLGYRRAWFYDTPALCSDVWITLALAAQRTSTIGLGTGVLVPRLRHVLVTAAAAAQIELLAPGRLVLGIGTGFTGSRALGQKAMKWADVATYVEALQALLRGETVDWEGGAIRMLQSQGFAPTRPIDIPIVIAAEGPKGLAVGRRLAQGLFVTGMGVQPPDDFDWTIRLLWGTVLDDGEAPASDRVLEAAGPAAAVTYHALYELGGADAVSQALPNGAAWVDRIATIPESQRHLAVHDGHLIRLSDIDRDTLPREVIPEMTVTGSADDVRAQLEAIAASGLSEIAYQPEGPDIARELEAFMAVAAG
ncbi:5,10-methylene tetrahydromethanopterin reductase [Mycobacterium sp. ACS1612]|uniref:LLM class flavin-dependent oxidoreductase n=1 Tax=Mycobacterium sp. ACS1612 TaxID=1834117 RepID=UPI0007FEF6C5|nr:LLM class flavin-dependent oxidoreductase [Mycobacterium sp. ACS1612]OBF36675.1 5,10-methylene tetrahydromethanopterin reductase [Mycobacterium sp. ACS1612]